MKIKMSASVQYQMKRCSVHSHFGPLLRTKQISQKVEAKRQRLFTQRFLPMMLLLSATFFIGSAYIITDHKEKILGLRSIIIFQYTRPKTCENLCGPEGSAALPKGIVARTSDLEMRPLWGLQSAKTSKMSKSLLAIAVGIKKKENVNKIVKKFPANDFVVMLFHYDAIVDEWKNFEWSDRAIHVSAVNQTKWWFAKRFLHPDIVSEYDYIFLWDEDLGVNHFNARRYLSIVKGEGLEISQPAVDHGNSKLHHPITARDNKSTVHRRTYKAIGKHKCNANSTNPPCAGFVEMMAPVFSRESWRCAWHMIQNDLVYGWGLNFQLGYCTQGDRSQNIGIVDAEYLVHSGVLSQGGSEVEQEPSLALKNWQAPPSDNESDVRSVVRKQSFIELETFKSRWTRAVKQDRCWVDPYQKTYAENAELGEQLVQNFPDPNGMYFSNMQNVGSSI